MSFFFCFSSSPFRTETQAVFKTRTALFFFPQFCWRTANCFFFYFLFLSFFSFSFFFVLYSPNQLCQNQQPLFSFSLFFFFVHNRFEFVRFFFFLRMTPTSQERKKKKRNMFAFKQVYSSLMHLLFSLLLTSYAMLTLIQRTIVNVSEKNSASFCVLPELLNGSGVLGL